MSATNNWAAIASKQEMPLFNYLFGFAGAKVNKPLQDPTDEEIKFGLNPQVYAKLKTKEKLNKEQSFDYFYEIMIQQNKESTLFYIPNFANKGRCWCICRTGNNIIPEIDNKCVGCYCERCLLYSSHPTHKCFHAVDDSCIIEDRIITTLMCLRRFSKNKLLGEQLNEDVSWLICSSQIPLYLLPHLRNPQIASIIMEAHPEANKGIWPLTNYNLFVRLANKFPDVVQNKENLIRMFRLSLRGQISSCLEVVKWLVAKINDQKIIDYEIIEVIDFDMFLENEDILKWLIENMPLNANFVKTSRLLTFVCNKKNDVMLFDTFYKRFQMNKTENEIILELVARASGNEKVAKWMFDKFKFELVSDYIIEICLKSLSVNFFRYLCNVHPKVRQIVEKVANDLLDFMIYEGKMEMLNAFCSEKINIKNESITKKTIEALINTNNVESIHRLYLRNYSFNKSHVELAIKSDSVACLKYFHTNFPKLKISHGEIQYAKDHESTNCLKYLCIALYKKEISERSFWLTLYTVALDFVYGIHEIKYFLFEFIEYIWPKTEQNKFPKFIVFYQITIAIANRLQVDAIDGEMTIDIIRKHKFDDKELNLIISGLIECSRKNGVSMYPYAKYFVNGVVDRDFYSFVGKQVRIRKNNLEENARREKTMKDIIKVCREEMRVKEPPQQDVKPEQFFMSELNYDDFMPRCALGRRAPATAQKV